MTSAKKPRSSLSFISASLKSVVHKMLVRFNLKIRLKCYANRFVKVNAQTEEENRRTISFLRGYSYPKLYCKKLSNQPIRRIQLALQEEQLYA